MDIDVPYGFDDKTMPGKQCYVSNPHRLLGLSGDELLRRSSRSSQIPTMRLFLPVVVRLRFHHLETRSFSQPLCLFLGDQCHSTLNAIEATTTQM